VESDDLFDFEVDDGPGLVVQRLPARILREAVEDAAVPCNDPSSDLEHSGADLDRNKDHDAVPHARSDTVAFM